MVKVKLPSSKSAIYKQSYFLLIIFYRIVSEDYGTNPSSPIFNLISPNYLINYSYDKTALIICCCLNI